MGSEISHLVKNKPKSTKRPSKITKETRKKQDLKLAHSEENSNFEKYIYFW